MKNQNILQLDFGFETKPVINQKNTPKTANKPQNDYIFEFMDCLTSPIIVFKSAWKGTIPSDILSSVKRSRLLCLMKGKYMASLTEVLAYMMPRTLESPMPSEWVNIYTWVGAQYIKSHKGEEKNEALAEIAPEHLTDYELLLLNDLRKWVYNKRRKALRDSLKTKKITKSNVVTTNQDTLFDN
ncbi:hypothetical protein [Flavivirga jejuensis]|uniref:Uncharacterized protein n=1 Tax=Flavivirga jejuensis TaxID=870487 RepID=A0ABT8WVJ5_9FLAO|nr:hypothetical protein [Flavivirga jejuensis]MDO5977129.1 hypothetical protein [Flavivirga jejuensis]